MTKTSSHSKLFFLFKIIIIYFIIFLKSHADNLNSTNDLVVEGSNDATVKIKIFSSLTCPHCANFHMEVVPQIKKKYVELGKVQLIFIDFPLDQAAFNASKLLHCIDKKKQIEFLDSIYEKQSKWTAGTNIEEINNNLKNMVKNHGIDAKQFNECLNNESIADKIINGRINANQKYAIESTPTIVINEKKFKGLANFENLKKKIEKLI